MDKDLVSVVIPAYNSENYIQECLNATLVQTYKNIEVIVVDDGSSDGTLELCRKYERKDKRVRVLTGINGGVSSARNRGLRAAQGKYVVFFDADDYPEIDLIESYLNSLKRWDNENISLVLCGMSNDNLVNSRIFNKKQLLEPDKGFVEGNEYILERNQCAVLAWLKLFNFVTNKIYDLEVIKSRKIVFDEEISIGEDLKFNLDYLSILDGKIGVINRAIYHYVKRSRSSLSISYYSGGIVDTKYLYKRFISWASTQDGITEDDILVIKAIFITDWIARLTALYKYKKVSSDYVVINRTLRMELQNREFQRTLDEVYKAHKIGTLRYVTLKTGIFGIFMFFRGIYQILKG